MYGHPDDFSDAWIYTACEETYMQYDWHDDDDLHSVFLFGC
jgi:hypothetical protein